MLLSPLMVGWIYSCILSERGLWDVEIWFSIPAGISNTLFLSLYIYKGWGPSNPFIYVICYTHMVACATVFVSFGHDRFTKIRTILGFLLPSRARLMLAMASCRFCSGLVGPQYCFSQCGTAMFPSPCFQLRLSSRVYHFRGIPMP